MSTFAATVGNFPPLWPRHVRDLVGEDECSEVDDLVGHSPVVLPFAIRAVTASSAPPLTRRSDAPFFLAAGTPGPLTPPSARRWSGRTGRPVPPDRTHPGGVGAGRGRSRPVEGGGVVDRGDAPTDWPTMVAAVPPTRLRAGPMGPRRWKSALSSICALVASPSMSNPVRLPARFTKGHRRCATPPRPAAHRAAAAPRSGARSGSPAAGASSRRPAPNMPPKPCMPRADPRTGDMRRSAHRDARTDVVADARTARMRSMPVRACVSAIARAAGTTPSAGHG